MKDEFGEILKITGTMDIGGAEDLRKALRDFLEAAPHPAVDLSQVEAIDTAVLQLLCSAHRTAERSGKRLEIAGMSAAVREKSEALGLSLADLASAPGRRGAADGI